MPFLFLQSVKAVSVKMIFRCLSHTRCLAVAAVGGRIRIVFENAHPFRLRILFERPEVHMNLKTSITAIILVAASFFATSLRAGEPCGNAQCCPSPTYICPQPTCQTPCQKSCCQKRFGFSFPSLRFSFSCPKIHCESDCCDSYSCCKRSCCVKRWWDEKEPPRIPIVNSVPAINVAQQAVAITPVQFGQPIQQVHQIQQQSAPCRDKSQLDETRLLLLMMLLKQQQAAATPQSAASPQSSSDFSDKQWEQIRQILREESGN